MQGTEAIPIFGDRALTARVGAALLLANVRYWTTVAPLVRAQMRSWELRALAIPDPGIRQVAVEKLNRERFTVEVAATLATLSSRRNRAVTVDAIVAIQVLYDYLEGLTEQRLPDPIGDGRQLFRAFPDAVTLGIELDDHYYPQALSGNDGGYLAALGTTIRASLSQLPASATIADALRVDASLNAEALVRVNAAASNGTAQLEAWARREATNAGREWREFLAGAMASVIAMHALVGAASDQRLTASEVLAIDATYVPIGVISTLLDNVVDHELDARAGRQQFIGLYANREEVAEQLTKSARRAGREARAVPHAPHHLMTMVGLVAWFVSAPEAKG
jgi:hypothetical protein